MSTLSIQCPVHGLRGAPAVDVRIAARPAAEGAVQHALTAPCPEPDCSITVLIPPRAVTAAVVERLFRDGAQVVKVAPHTAAASLVEFPVPQQLAGSRFRLVRPTSSTPGGVA